MSMIENSSQLNLFEGSRPGQGPLTLQKSFLAEGPIAASPVAALILRFSYESIAISFPGEGEYSLVKSTAGTKVVETDQDIHRPDYSAAIPIDCLLENNNRDTVDNFIRYFAQQMRTDPLEIDSLALPITVSFSSDEEIPLGGSIVVSPIYFLKNFFDPSQGGPIDVNNGLIWGHADNNALQFIRRNAFFVNRTAYEAFAGDMPSALAGVGARVFPLHLIGFITDLSSGSPVHITEPDEYVTGILQQLAGLYNVDMQTVLDIAHKHWDAMFDFPLSTAAIRVQDVGGTFTITGADGLKLTIDDFKKYDLSLEYSAPDEYGDSEMVDIHYDWSQSPVEFSNNTIPFSFSAEQLIIPAEVHEVFTVYVRSPDGMELWSKEYRAGSAAIRNMAVSVNLVGSGATKPDDRTVVNPKRLRGQILDMTGQKATLKDAVIVIEAKVAGNAHWRIIGSAISDKDGYFSLPYPTGIYTAAQAVVSLMPHSPATIAITKNMGDSRTISDDFLYLMLKAVTAPANAADGSKDKEDDCDCHNTLKATRLPDQADLIHSDEYTQDLGAGCINLSTPNRTLKEYNHYAVVRTSDPDVANYTLTRDKTGKFTLAGDKKKIRRRAIDLNNPIRWQDAPDSELNANDTKDSYSNLNFYQAVTIATGHILHYKSMFKADGYSLGELLYSLPLAPGQKKQIVVFDSSHNLQGSESQQLSVSERLAANITNDRDVSDQLSGNISEGLRGSSSAMTAGVAAAAGVAASSGAVGGAVGVAGGYATASSDASQDSARNISQFFTEKLRNNVMQNADSYRQQNASVVSTVTEGQKYSATTEVVANHNHCHSLTMMYFEVLRHYAIYQELSSVEECVFVPLLMTHFTPENVHKWQDVLAANLLPVPANTYLPSVDGQHPLIKGFDAIHRRNVKYENIDFPTGAFDEESIRSITGNLRLRVSLPRPKTRYDRILSLPIVNKIVTHEEVDYVATAKAAAWTAGLSFLFGGPSMKTVSDVIQVKAQLFDAYMQMDPTYESVPPAQCMRVTSFQQSSVIVDGHSVPVSGVDFFGNDILDKQLWEAYAALLGFTDVFVFLDTYFRGRLIAEWDTIYYNDIAPALYERIVKNLSFVGAINDKKEGIGPGIGGSFTPLGRYTGGEVSMDINVRASTKLTRKDMGEQMKDLTLYGNKKIADIRSPATLMLEHLTLTYSTPHFTGILFDGYVGDDLQDGAKFDIPESLQDKRNPILEDAYIAGKLIDHLNSNVEYYNKILWYNLDTDRRYMLLDGFNVQIFNDFGVPIGLKSLSSVIKNELITVAGNSLVFPVSPGFKISRSYLVEKTATGTTERVELLNHYKPLTPPAPYRVSVPTKGLFVEAVKGMCDSCEKVEPNTSQDWEMFKPDEPTAINPLTAPTPTVTDWKATFKDIATATVGMQAAPVAPAVGAGLAGLSDALTKADTFRDVTGLAANQANAMSTYKSSMDAATKMAEIAKGMATQEHNTDKSNQIMDKLKDAKASGAISSDDYNKLVKQHLQQQIDGGDSTRAQAAADAAKAKITKPSITEAAVGAVGAGKQVKATKTDADGNIESVEISAGSGGTGTGTTTTPGTDTTPVVKAPKDGGNVLAAIDKPIPLMAQKDDVSCWAVAATMMMSWKAGMPADAKSDKIRALDVTDVLNIAGPEYVELYTGKSGMKPSGLPGSKKEDLLMALEMNVEGPKCFEAKNYISWLKTYGPLWLTTDAIPDDPHYALHARVLTRVTGTSDTSDDIYFHFNDPANAEEEQHIPYLQFAKEYEEAAKDAKSTKVFSQVVHFGEKGLWARRPDWAAEIKEIETGMAKENAAAKAAGVIMPVAEDDDTEGYKVGGPMNWFHNEPVHETITLTALRASKFDLPGDAVIPYRTTAGSNRDVNEFFRGVIWNDDPAGLLFENSRTFENDNMNYNSGYGWYQKFTAGEQAPFDRSNFTGRTHYGDLQFLHAMARLPDEPAAETLAKIMMWAEFTYRVAIGDGIPGTTQLKDLTITSEYPTLKMEGFGNFFDAETVPIHYDTVSKLFLQGSSYKKPILERRSLGSLLHMIEDSYAIGHTKRELLNPGDLQAGKDYEPVPKKFADFGKIITFHSYADQNKEEHGKYDYLGIAGMNDKDPESLNRIPGARNALKHVTALIDFWVNKTPWKSGVETYLRGEVFALHKDATAANGKI